VTHAELRRALHYDPKTGAFRWATPGYGRRAKVGYLRPDGYLVIRIDGRNYLAGPLAWFWMTGEWPKNEIDHDNRKRADNRWKNLKDATRLENARNRNRSKNNTSGTNGVSWHAGNRRWCVKLRQKYLGAFLTKAEAVAFARRAA
jgi:hypothetical protein